MSNQKGLNRREFLRLTGLAGAAIAIDPRMRGAMPLFADQKTRTLIVAAPATPAGVDPDFYAGTEYEFMAINIYEPPIQFKVTASPEGVPMADSQKPGNEGLEGCHIESWELADDEVTYTLHLRKGVKSFYGNELTADDFLWKVQRGYELKASTKFLWDAAGLTGPEDVTIIDDHTVQVKTSRGPNPIFLKILTVMEFGLIDSVEAKKHATEEDPWATEWLVMNDAAFGPWHIDEFKAGEQVILVQNPNYWGEKPYFEKIFWKAVPEAATRLALLVSGDVHFADQFLSFEQRKQLEGGKGEAKLVQITPTNSVNMLQMQCNMPPFNNVKARQAMAYAIPYEDINETAFFGLAAPAAGHIPPSFPDATEEFWKYDTDLDKAKQLWDESGAPREFTLSWDGGMVEHERAAILIKNNLERIGVNVTLEKLPGAVFADRMSPDSSMQAWLHWAASWINDAPYNVWMWWGEAAFNFKEYRNAELDELITKTMSMLASPERTQMTLRMQEILAEEVPSIYINYSGWHQAVNKDLGGVTWYPDSDVRFSQLKWEE